jgi:hypothetical protein
VIKEFLVAEGECIHKCSLKVYCKATVHVLFNEGYEGLKKLK